MTKSQLDNLIHFCFIFRVDIGIDSCSSDYILEKWNKFIGVKPYSNDGVSVEYLEEDMRDLKKYNGCVVGMGREDIHRVESLLDWSKKWGDYDKVKEILHFILLLDSKEFISGRNLALPSELVSLFEDWIGNPEEINKEEYTHIHTNTIKDINEWLENTDINRDYKLSILV
jgi:hypothetical protein